MKFANNVGLYATEYLPLYDTYTYIWWWLWIDNDEYVLEIFVCLELKCVL